MTAATSLSPIGGEGGRRPGEGAKGFILVEASITYVVIAFAICALMPVFALAIKSNKKTEQIAVAAQLAEELLEEVRLRKWDENTPLPKQWIPTSAGIGRESGESASDKRDFDDADDFHGWVETSAVDPVMRALPSFEAYRREVAVEFVDENLATAASPTDLKLVRVCVTRQGMKPVCVSSLMANR